MIGKTNAVVGGGAQLKDIPSIPFTTPSSMLSPSLQSSYFLFSREVGNRLILPISNNLFKLDDYKLDLSSVGNIKGYFKVTIEDIVDLLNMVEMDVGTYELGLCFCPDSNISNNLPTSYLIYDSKYTVHVKKKSDGTFALYSSSTYNSVLTFATDDASVSGRIYLLHMMKV